MKDFYTDEEFAQFEQTGQVQNSAPDFISDEEMNQLSPAQSNPLLTKYEIPKAPAKVKTKEEARANYEKLKIEGDAANKQAEKDNSFWGLTKGTLKNAWNMVTSSEQGLGKSIAEIYDSPEEYVKNIGDLNESQRILQKLIKEGESSGKDTIKLKQIYNDNVDMILKNQGEIESDIDRLPTKGQLGGQIGGTALDLLTAGTYGKTATTGMKSGELAFSPAKGVLPNLIPATKGVAPAVGKVGEIAAKTPGLFTKAGMKAVVKGAGIGYGYDVSQGLQGNRGEERDEFGALIPGAGTLFGAGLPMITGATASVQNALNKDKKLTDGMSSIFPTLKKDVVNIEQKNKNIYTAFKDISDNKSITDDGVTFRNPKNFVETVEAQNVRMPKIYEEYTKKLQGVEKVKFESKIQSALKDELTSIKDKLLKENSIDNRRALTKIQAEIGTLRDPSPIGIQNYIQSINQKIRPSAPGGALTAEQIQYANLGGSLRKILDEAVEQSGGKEYQALRNIYSAHKAIQSQLLMAARKEINGVPGLTDRLGTLGMTIEGINFLVTQNPSALAAAVGIKGTTKLLKWLSSPQRALNNTFKRIDKNYRLPAQPRISKIPQETMSTAAISSNNMIPSVIPKNNQSGKTTPAVLAAAGLGLGAAALANGEEEAPTASVTGATMPGMIPVAKKTPFDTEGFKSEVVRRENSGNPDSYDVIGFTGDLGKYQVKRETLEAYSDDFLGKKVTPKEFLNSPELQEKFFEGFLKHMQSKSVREPRLNDQKMLLALWHRGFGDLRKERLDRLLSEPASAKYVGIN